jgi:hypothetical protein
MSSDSKVIKTSYWSRIKKKSITKQVNTKKFGGDEVKAREFLENWKIQERQKEEETMAGNNQPKKTEEEIEVKKEELNNEVPESSVSASTGVTIHKTKFNLDIPVLTEDGGSTVLFGNSKGGKTTILKNLVSRYYDNKNVITILFAQNAHAKIYKSLPKSVIKTDYFDPELIHAMHRIQRKTNNKYAFVILMDDMIMEKNDPMLMQMLLTLRNSKISTVILLQDLKLMSRAGRHNINNIIFTKQNTDDGITDVLKLFIGSYPPFNGLNMEEKIRTFREATTDYSFIYFNALDGILSFHNKLPLI